MDDFYDDLSENPTLASITKLVGEDAAEQISMEFGGVRLHIPCSPGKNSPLSVVVGLDAAKKIAQTYGGMYFDVPVSLGKRARIVELSKMNVPAGKIARTLWCTERYVFKVRAEEKQDDGQTSLPL